MTRRSVLGAGAGAIATPWACAASGGRRVNATVDPSDEVHWQRVSALYRVNRELTNLENGYWGVMATPVLAEYRRRIEQVEFDNTIWARSSRANDSYIEARHEVADALAVDEGEIALTRGATEALQKLIGGYNRLNPGDAVLFCDLDYGSMQSAMRWLRERRGVEVVTFAIPEPPSRQAVLDAYDAQLRAHPNIKLVLVTHLSHRTGLVMPVREIVERVEARGGDVIVDAAHAWGQMNIAAPDLAAPFIGFNLHKWIGAPLGCGAMFIRRDRLDRIDRDYGDDDYPSDDIRSRVHTGTVNFAAWMTIPRALALRRDLGPAAVAARLKYLRDRWVRRASKLPGLQLLTPVDGSMSASITSFRIAGRAATDVVAQLRDDHRVLTVVRRGITAGDAVRVTPALLNTEDDVDRLVRALETLTGAATPTSR